MGLSVGFADDGQGVYIRRRLSEREDLEPGVGLAVAAVVAAVRVGRRGVAAIHRHTVVVDVLLVSVARYEYWG